MIARCSRSTPVPRWSLVLGTLVAIALVAPVTYAQEADDDAETSDRLTWGVVPSGPDGPTGERSFFELHLEPGERTVDHLGIINYTLEDLTLDVYAQDAFTSEEGGFDILPAGERSTGAGTWVELDVEEVIVPARSRVDVPFRLTVPARATPGDHATGIVAALRTVEEDAAGNQVAVDRRVGARVYVRVAGDLEPGLAVNLTDAHYGHRWNPLATGTATFTFEVENVGNVRLASDPTASTRWLFGWLPRETSGDRLPELLPGESVTRTVEVAGVVPLVWQRGEVSLDLVPPEGLAPDEPLERLMVSQSLWTIPWTLLLTLAVAVAVVVVRRRRNGDPDEESAAEDDDPVAASDAPASVS